MNNSLVIDSAKAFAARLEREAGAEMHGRVRRGYELAYSRFPRPKELKLIHAAIEGKDRDQAVWVVFCQALFGSNEFLYSY